MQTGDPMLELLGWLMKATLQMATPLVLTALGGMFSERTGVVNIGLEGMMLVGAFSAVAGTYYTGSPWLGLIIAVIAGGALAGVHALVCVKFKGNHIVSGTGIILLGMGITTLGLQVVWGKQGLSDSVQRIPEVVFPQLQGVPLLGTAFGSLSPFIYFMFIITALSWYVLYRTPFGLRIRAAGEDPSTLDAAGVSVEWTRIIGVVISGALAGLGGAYLSIGFENAFGKGMTAGKGFIALAALIFGNWTPVGCFLAGIFFGFVTGLQFVIPILAPGLIQLTNLVKIIPYALVIVALAGIRRSIPPKGIAIPYEKEKSG
ncbi:MAG: ABC transporter permease [Candidatus Thorarchaeota archaeon]|jgi:simple sugar transport system permease protein